MPKTLYFRRLKFLNGDFGAQPTAQYSTSYGVQPRTPNHALATRRISLKRDLKWREVKNLQEVMRGADFWEGFPEDGVRLIAAEVKAGAEDQRIDLLYLREDGGVFPCELKIGGSDKDSHGQLIRYLADLADQTVTRNWVIAQRKLYLSRRYRGQDKAAQKVKSDLREFEQKIVTIPAKDFKLLPNKGIIVDEAIPSALKKTVLFLNSQFNFDLRLIRAQAFTADDWNLDQEEYAFRIEFTDIV